MQRRHLVCADLRRLVRRPHLHEVVLQHGGRLRPARQSRLRRCLINDILLLAARRHGDSHIPSTAGRHGDRSHGHRRWSSW